ncbi:uncharacterized protein LOC124152978 [Haliotis rufescens]|uniref:uncharacterized protein LOC124152978 n=1 Tax=Haliotis rufescens TaxID=6454 RepID=UPI001EB06BEA|nr:uncharacterized protein LOC124152978 [Haliotis rufescens]
MEWLLIVCVLLATVAGTLTQGLPRLSSEDYTFLERLPSPRVALPAGFKVKYVGEGGVIKDSKQSSGHWIEIAGSPHCSDSAVYEAALIISLQSRHMPTEVFSRLAGKSSVGVFTKAEKITIYPEFYHLKDTPDCKGTCAGHCSHTCTSDGRKWESLGGVDGTGRAIVLDDNVLCTPQDPHHHRENILVHEFGHGVQKYGLDSARIQKVIAAYNHAKAAHLWTHSAYAMTNYKEYFAEASTAFFNVNQQTSAAGMNKCGHGYYCDTEAHARAWLKRHDPQIYDVLVYAYTNNHPEIASHLKICQSH